MNKKLEKIIHSKSFLIAMIVLLIILVISAGTYAWFTWSSTNNTNLTMSIGASSDVVFKNGNDISTNKLAPVFNYTDGEKTTFTITNKSNTSFSYRISLNITSIDNELKNKSLKYKLVSNNTIITEGDFSNIESNSKNTLYEGELSKGNISYIFYLYIDGNEENDLNMINKSLVGTITVEEKPTLAKEITDLYTNATKTTTTVNSVTYNLASSVGLMNDRKGSMSTGIDAGNIRYYGKTKITKVPGWQSDEIFSKYCPPKTCFNSESTCIDFLVNSVYELSETEAKKQCTEEKENVSMAETNNYIYFNCSDYSNQSSDTCETWRIIGVFDGNVKIMRGSQIGTYSWDSSASDVNSGMGVNEWSQADLMKLLNSGYDSESIGGSLYWNAGIGECYNERNNAKGSCDFTSTRLKNAETRNMIAETTYYTRGHDTNKIFVDAMYDKERVSGTVSDSTRTLTWTGKVAIPYPSDYGYAADLSLCQKALYDYGDSKCTVSNWMKNILTNNGANEGWLLTPYPGTASYAWYVNQTGGVNSNTSLAFLASVVVPVLSLTSELGIGSGTGTSSSPYQLSV